MDTEIRLRVPKELKDEAQKKAKSQGESLSVYIRQMIRDWVDEK